MYDTSPGGLGVYEGPVAIGGLLEDRWGAFSELRFEPEEILGLGNGVVLAVSGHTGRPFGGPGHVRLPREVLVHVFVWEQGMVTRVVSSGDTPEARAAAERLAEARG